VNCCSLLLSFPIVVKGGRGRGEGKREGSPRDPLSTTPPYCLITTRYISKGFLTGGEKKEKKPQKKKEGEKRSPARTTPIPSSLLYAAPRTSFQEGRKGYKRKGKEIHHQRVHLLLRLSFDLQDDGGKGKKKKGELSRKKKKGGHSLRASRRNAWGERKGEEKTRSERERGRLETTITLFKSPLSERGGEERKKSRKKKKKNSERMPGRDEVSVSLNCPH